MGGVGEEVGEGVGIAVGDGVGAGVGAGVGGTTVTESSKKEAAWRII